ncbi:PREDICTED: uncharacterized protein LOC105364263, partial [Ceratosolen solmsi marchali]|uniref:Uncharacterized protein LOC105364263 n=1 Tax=Ceratosolen solmsi marchali TaxID=326594 RepID=A0AAJ6YLX3_9HYME
MSKFDVHHDNMASSALEEKIIKIKLQNEEIRRRHEEVEADKKNAAKLNALVKMVPSDDWPERKEPPEFSAPPKITQKQKALNKEHNDRPPQHYSGIQDRLGKKDHKFAQGDGPPPDPKYNFLADSEREIRITDNSRVDESKNRSRNKASRGSKKRGGDSGGGSRDAYFKDNRGPHAFYSREEALPEYEAWRAERNRIDEARISRQKTAEGNWRREWDSNKTNVEKDPLRKGDSNRKESNNYDRRNNHYDSDYSNRGHGGSRTYHGSQKNHNQDYRRSHHEQIHEYKRQLDNKPPLSPNDDRTVTATDKSIKVTLNHGNQTKGPVMSVKVNSPSIAGTGRVGPRQKSRVTYSSQSDADVTVHELNNFSRQKSFDEKTAGAYFNSGQKSTPKSPFSQRKKDSNSKSAYNQRKEFKNDESSTRTKIAIKTTYSQRNESKDQRQLNNLSSKVQRIQKRSQKQCVINKEESLSISDEAIPCEYNPDKSFSAREDVNKEKLDTEYE